MWVKDIKVLYTVALTCRQDRLIIARDRQIYGAEDPKKAAYEVLKDIASLL